MTTHLVIDKEATKDEMVEIKLKSKELFADHQFEHVTIEVEFEDEDCRMKQ